MAETNLVLWKGGVKSLQQDMANSPIIQSRFFLPSEILISRYGIVGMVVVDNRPRYRCVSYTEGDWLGISGELTSEEFVRDYGTNDVVRQAHFVNTKEGFSILRTFVLPSKLTEILERNKYLSEPMIDNWACNEVFDVEFDEVKGWFSEIPVKDAMPVIEAVAESSWKVVQVPDVALEPYRQVRAWVSFHGWFAFTEALEQAQQALQKGLGGFDYFLEHMVPQAQPYSTSLVKTSNSPALEKL